MDNIVVYGRENPMPHEKFTRLFDIMERSFPREEHGSARYHYAEQSRREFRCLCYEPEGAPAAFMNYYVFPERDMIFLEHFAVSQQLRGNGIGSRLMRHFKELTSPSMIVLEVEPPEGETECRRISFYQRMGFFLNSGEYFQPAFGKDMPDIPLKLMSTEPLEGARFQDAAALIHKKVYLR